MKNIISNNLNRLEDKTHVKETSVNGNTPTMQEKRIKRRQPFNYVASPTQFVTDELKIGTPQRAVMKASNSIVTNDGKKSLFNKKPTKRTKRG
jgi:hypothetical protein